MEQTIRKLRDHIQYYAPFECDDFDALCSAIIEEYYAETWNSQLIWVLGCIRSLQAMKVSKGSWNVPIKYVLDGVYRKQAYKIIRQKKELQNNIFVNEYRYEFHNAPVIFNQWIQAEISSSKGLTGLTPKAMGGTGGRFHMLLDEYSANAYTDARTNDSWFPRQEAITVKVNGRKWQTIDLIYIPPKTWVWGIDAEEVYIEL